MNRQVPEGENGHKVCIVLRRWRTWTNAVLRLHFTSFRMAIVKRTNDSKRGENVGKREPYKLLVWMWTCAATMKITCRLPRRLKIDLHMAQLYPSWLSTQRTAYHRDPCAVFIAAQYRGSGTSLDLHPRVSDNASVAHRHNSILVCHKEK